MEPAGKYGQSRASPLGNPLRQDQLRHAVPVHSITVPALPVRVAAAERSPAYVIVAALIWVLLIV